MPTTSDATVKQGVFSPSRRVQLWLKNSIATSATTATSFHPSKEAYNDMPEFPLCRNIDEALHSFHVEETAYTIADDSIYYDWILDGLKDDAYHQQRSRELMEEMRVPDIEDVVIIRDISWEASQRALQFASFPHEEDDSGDEEFGDFQEASENQTDLNNCQHCTTPETAGIARLKPRDKANDSVSMDGTACEKLKNTSGQKSSIQSKACDDLPDQPIVEEKKEEEEDDDDSDAISVPTEVKLTVTESDYSIDILSCSSHEEDGADEAEKWDLSTLEGRYLRRQIPEQMPIPISLPSHFFQEAESTTLCEAMVRSLPWKHVPFIQKDFCNTETSEQDMAAVEEHLMSQLMQLDGWLASITIQSLRQISHRKNSIELCNQHLRELNHNLSMADLHAQQSKNSLQQARGDDCTGLSSEMVLLEAWDQRDVYRDLDTLLTSCANLLDQEERLTQQIKSFGQNPSRFEEIIESARLFSLHAHEDKRLSKLTALGDLRCRANCCLDTFAAEIESLLLQLVSNTCVSWKKFSVSNYGYFLKAMVCIRQKQDSPQSVPENWTKCIVETLLFEAEKCLARALLDPTNEMDSSHNKELLNLEYALHEGHGDFAKLKTVSHNLVTIRFDFEASHNYFPLVYHRLCLLLTDLLHCHCVIMNWHTDHFDLDKDLNERIYRQLWKSKLKLWKRCEQVLGSCLDEYVNFAAKKKLFGERADDSLWTKELEDMHDVLQLTQQICTIGKEFMGVEAQQKVTCILDESCDRALRSKLCAAFRKHLRAVHVETMNSTGFMLSKESWQLVPLYPVENGLTGFCSSETELKAYLAKLVGDIMFRQTPVTQPRLWENRLRTAKDALFPTFAELGNPFDLSLATDKEKNQAVFDFNHVEIAELKLMPEAESIGVISEVYELFGKMVDNGLTVDSRIAVESCFKGFAKCIARLLLVMKKLPVILPDVVKVIENLSDLFLTTVFRLCTGSPVNENLVLGVAEPKRYVMELPPNKRKTSTPLIGFGRRPTSDVPTRPSQPITSKLEAEICSPLGCDKSDADSLKYFIQRAQSSLEGMVNLDMVQRWICDPAGISPDESEDEYLCKVCSCLEKRQSASWSCLFVAAILDLVKNFAVTKCTKSTMASMLCEATEGYNDMTLNGVSTLVDYADSVIAVVPKIIHFSAKMACARAIGSRRIVEEISRAEWGSSLLSESANLYVDSVCARYAFIWRFLSTSAKLPVGVRSYTWETLVTVGYSTFLEGYARVPYCSTEGRSSMSMDLAAFSSGVSPSSIEEKINLDGIPRPPTTGTLPRGRQYVDNYIKASYFPQEDIMKWIATNYNNYHLNHCIALTGSRTDLTRYVEGLYAQDGSKNASMNQRGSS